MSPNGRFANGTPVSDFEAELLSRAFGFSSAREMNDICARADARRAADTEIRHRIAGAA
ncbi:hypothetical protein [Nocardia sp. CA-145437]|uniref:hypothetical protein n=1 Tax=Nocardia sp. CA-145437 TaxID=3239980 RepID=UPI003D987958